MSEEEQNLISYFEGQPLPAPPLRLSASEVINDLPGFVATQIRHLRSGMSVSSAKQKLERLRQRIEALKND